MCSLSKRIPLQITYEFIVHAIQATYKACINLYYTIPIWGDQYKLNTIKRYGIRNSLLIQPS
jgi:hypothetical protein